MLPYILAIAIGSSSLILFGIAFFSPKIHRQDDFLWSGVGLFYALVLWLCAGRVTGAVLLGQTAAVILLISFGWQTLKLRRIFAYPEQQADLEGFSIMNWGQSRFSSLMGKKKPVSVPSASEPITPPVTEPEPPIISEPEAQITETPESVEETPPATETIVQETPQPLDEPQPEVKPAPAPKTSSKKGFSLKGLFNFRKPQPKPETIQQALAQVEAENKDQDDWETEEPKAEEPKPEQTQETVTTTLEQEEQKELSFLDVTSVDPFELGFESFVPDDQAETIIEVSPMNLNKPKVEVTEEPPQEQPQVEEEQPSEPIEVKATHPPEPSEVKDEKPEKSE